MPSAAEMRAFLVHIFTASGVALGFCALLAATMLQWTLMFTLLAVALVVDGVDGWLARRFDVAARLPRWSGDVLDLVVDFITYVFVPAYAICVSGLLPEAVSVPAAVLIVTTGALYFADTQMKTPDHFFRGFPGLWNAAAFYLFLLQPAPWAATATIGILAVLTFVPFKFVHPFRVKRARRVTAVALAAWAALALHALVSGLAPGPWTVGGLVALGIYFVLVGLLPTARASRET